MKKDFILILLLLCSLSWLAAQTNGTWSLRTNGNCANTGYVIGSPATRGAGGAIGGYNTNGIYSTSWGEATLALAISNNDYYQYTITATQNISITTVAVDMYFAHSQTPIAWIYASVNGGGYTAISSAVNVTQAQVRTTVSGLNVGIMSGQTYSVRVYAYGGHNNKDFYNRDMVITAYQSVATDYFRTISSGNWNAISSWDSSPNGTNWYHSSLTPTASANTVTIQNGNVITLTAAAACNNLSFSSGSITLGNNNLTINGTLSGTPYYTYSGSGFPSQTGTGAHVTVTTTTPTSLPDTLNTLTINPGPGNTVTMPNNVTTTDIAFTSGSLALNNYSLTLDGKDFAITSPTAAIADMTVAEANTSNTFNGSTSIARTWTTTGSLSDAADISFTYPESETSASSVKVWRRAVGSTGQWVFVGTFNPTDNGDTRTVIATGVTDLGGTTGYDWTITTLDQTLPVELSSFTGSVTLQNFIMVQWITQSETGVSGFYLFRNNGTDLNTAQRINAFISATNTSQEVSYAFIDRDAVPGSVYYYWLQNVEMSGETNFFGPISVTLSPGGGEEPIIPVITSLRAVYPNPFSQVTTVAFGVAKTTSLSIEIINSKGQVVRHLYSGSKAAGIYNLNWNGRDDSGKVVSTGFFFARMTSGGKVNLKKMVMLK